MIPRAELTARVVDGLRHSPVTALLGPRQCGKTTLARAIAKQEQGTYFDLENPKDHHNLDQAQAVLESLSGLVVLDEIHRRPELMQLLRVLADRRPLPCRFLLLGSASPDLLRGASETLAGRIRFVDMGGLTLGETGTDNLDRLWIRGGFPDSFLAQDEATSLQWRENFIQTFLERDLPQLGFRLPAMTMRRFWMMLAHYHGQIWNGSEIGASLGVSHHATRRYLDALSGAYMVRQLQPWFINVGKRVVKSPKVYIRDSGLLHALLGIPDLSVLQPHPKLGASWEGFILEQMLDRIGERHAYFWATHSQAELDLMLVSRGKNWGVEIKYQDAPGITRSMRFALTNLDLAHLWVIYPGTKRYAMDEHITAVPACEIPALATELTKAHA